MRNFKTHILKTWIPFFKQVANGNKKFELRKEDRDFHVNDFLLLQEYDNEGNFLTGMNCLVQITYIFDNFSNDDCQIQGIQPGYCIISFNLLSVFGNTVAS